MREQELKQFLLDKIEEITEEIHQNSSDSCPFCCQESYPVNGDIEGWEEVEDAGLEAEEYHIDHYDDCFITVLDKYYIKIEKNGLW